MVTIFCYVVQKNNYIFFFANNKVVKEVITAQIIVPIMVLTEDSDKLKSFKASLYPHIINIGNMTITGIKNKKRVFPFGLLTGIGVVERLASLFE